MTLCALDRFCCGAVLIWAISQRSWHRDQDLVEVLVRRSCEDPGEEDDLVRFSGRSSHADLEQVPCENVLQKFQRPWWNLVRLVRCPGMKISRAPCIRRAYVKACMWCFQYVLVNISWYLIRLVWSLKVLLWQFSQFLLEVLAKDLGNIIQYLVMVEVLVIWCEKILWRSRLNPVASPCMKILKMFCVILRVLAWKLLWDEVLVYKRLCHIL